VINFVHGKIKNIDMIGVVGRDPVFDIPGFGCVRDKFKIGVDPLL
jgi:hypothetical protein